MLLWGKSGVDMIQLGPDRYNGRLPILGPHYLFQKYRLGVPVLQSEEDAAEVLVAMGATVRAR